MAIFGCRSLETSKLLAQVQPGYVRSVLLSKRSLPRLIPASFNGTRILIKFCIGFRMNSSNLIKYVEVYGSPTKSWEKVSRRVRGRLNLEAKSIMETYVGKRKKLCKRQIWFWVKKAWSWNGFRFFEKSNLWQFITFDCIWLFCKECSI